MNAVHTNAVFLFVICFQDMEINAFQFQQVLNMGLKTGELTISAQVPFNVLKEYIQIKMTLPASLLNINV